MKGYFFMPLHNTKTIGGGGMLMQFVKGLIKRINGDEVFSLAAQLAYFLLMSFFPFLIFLVSLIGMLSIRQINVIGEIANMLPPAAAGIVMENSQHIYDASSPTMLSLGFIITLWLTSNGVLTIMNALNKAFDIIETRSFIRVEATAIFYTIIL